MVPGLAGGKMSSSDPNSKIDFLDSPALVRKKIKAAFCEEGNIEDNGLLAFAKAVLIPIVNLRKEQVELGQDAKLPAYVAAEAPAGSVFTIPRDEKWGGSSHYATYEDLENDFKEKKIHPGDLKKAVGEAIISLLEPIQKDYESNKEWQEVTAKAYPSEAPKSEQPKKKTKVPTSAPSAQALQDLTFAKCITGLPPTSSRKGQECKAFQWRASSCRRRKRSDDASWTR